MSGIYGFTCRFPSEASVTDALEGLAYWNRIFGREAHADRRLSDSGIGCCIEHFSDKFPYGGPVLDFGGKPAVVDALLYNRDELTGLLELDEGCTLSDEELLLRLIEQKGFDALARVNGDFAAAIFDPEAGEWTLFRDHFGVRPLYLYLDDGMFAFSTDLRGLIALPNADLSLDDADFYARFIGGNFLSLQRTNFARIRCALPAAVTTVRRTADGFSLTEKTYWRIRQKKIRFRTEKEYRQALYDLIADAVNRRCDAIPGILGAELSGGFDSGVIDILLNRHGREALYYSWSTDPEDLPLREGTDERKVVLDICRQENIECRFYRKQDAQDFRRNPDPAIPPFADTTFLSYGSAWMRSGGARVVFTGHAGDEGVSHRATRFELLYNGELLSYLKLFWQDTRGKRFRLLRTLKWAFQDARSRLQETRSQKPSQLDSYSILNPRFCKRVSNGFIIPPFPFNYAPHKYVMTGGTRPRMENAAYQGAFNGVRYLFPYVDYRVFDFALSIPRRLYINHKQNRVIFREAFRDIIPKSLYEVTYKDFASRRDQRKQAEESDRDSLGLRLQWYLERLDRDVWSDIFDFQAMEELIAMGRSDPRRKNVPPMMLMELSRCLTIQNILTAAPKWREFDERDNKTV